MSSICENDWYMGIILNNSEVGNQLIIPTDKTNSFKCFTTKLYLPILNEDLVNLEKRIDREKSDINL